ncbi:hypothetical protein H072_2033 [Dactylellina haptotyla CBS 200.50]|uniref:Uncharacterized protein n=1 Tax=Dactylellina haptotyla (strain CBS 200.50) TaxID=1284197 RepID=S8ALY1_DACHA|nr:hypothetical protein H072_2033 [Dactylellina haptotyla CBS 200.50]
MARRVRADWFKSFRYFWTSTNLNPRDLDTCYLITGKTIDGDVDWLAIYNKPGEPPALGIAFYNNQQCGERSSRTQFNSRALKKPIFIMTLPRDNPYGIHFVNLKELGIKYVKGSYRAVNATEEFRPGGLLAGIPQDNGNGLYVWEASPTNLLDPVRRVYVPNQVKRIPEPTNILERVDLEGTRLGYIFMRDQVERYLDPTTVGLEDTVTPWIEASLSGAWDNVPERKRPGLKGPRYIPNKKGVSDNKQAWEGVEPLVRTHRRGAYGDEDRTIVYTGVKPDVVPGLVYYELNKARLLPESAIPHRSNDQEPEIDHHVENVDNVDESNAMPVDEGANSEFWRFLNDVVSVGKAQLQPDNENSDGSLQIQSSKDISDHQEDDQVEEIYQLPIEIDGSDRDSEGFLHPESRILFKSKYLPDDRPDDFENPEPYQNGGVAPNLEVAPAVARIIEEEQPLIALPQLLENPGGSYAEVTNPYSGLARDLGPNAPRNDVPSTLNRLTSDILSVDSSMADIDTRIPTTSTGRRSRNALDEFVAEGENSRAPVNFDHYLENFNAGQVDPNTRRSSKTR